MNASIAPERDRFRVLVVDDNRDAANSLALVLTVWGCEARAAYDGRSGLAEALEFHPHCFILDIGLPYLDGYALARRLREIPEFKDAKLIALTAYSGREHDQRVREAGFDVHLVKPAAPTEIQRIITMMQQVVDLARNVVLWHQPMPLDWLAYVYACALVAFAGGAVFFALLRRSFAEAI